MVWGSTFAWWDHLSLVSADKSQYCFTSTAERDVPSSQRERLPRDAFTGGEGLSARGQRMKGYVPRMAEPLQVLKGKIIKEKMILEI